MKTVTICGSMRFAEQMQHIAFELEAHNGWNVLQCVYDTQGTHLTQEMLNRLKAAHYAKIDLSDAIYVVDIGGYVGEAVREEIKYAKSRQIDVIYHSKAIKEGF